MPYPKNEVMYWYTKSMVWDMINSSTGHFHENMAEDWTRLKIFNPETNKLEPAMGDGHVGEPSFEDISRLYSAYKDGNLFVYPLGAKVPLKSTYSEKSDAMVFRPVDVDKFREGMDPNNVNAPVRSDFVPEVSGIKRFFYRLFNWFKDEVEAYDNGVASYENALKEYPDRKQAAAIIGNESERAKTVEAELPEKKFREESYDSLKTMWRMDHALDALDHLFAPRPQRVFPQVYLSKIAPHGGTLSEKEFQQLESHGYDLPKNSKVSQREAAVINLLFTCAPSVTMPALQKKYPDAMAENQSRSGVNMLVTGAFFHPRTSLEWSGAHAAFDKAKVAINAYQKGDATMLGQLIADGVRNFNAFSNSYKDPNSADKCGFGILAEQMLNLLNNHPDLLAASGLTNDDMEQLQSHIAVTKIARNSFEAQVKLHKAEAGLLELTPEEKAQCIADIATNSFMYQQFAEDMVALEQSEEFREYSEQMTAKFAEQQALLEAAKAEVYDQGMDAMNKRIKEWTAKHGEPGLYILNIENFRPMGQFQKKLAMPGVTEALIEGVRNLDTLKENVKDLTGKQLVEIAKNPQKLFELISNSQEGKSFSMNPPVKQQEKEMIQEDAQIQQQENTVVNNFNV